MSQDRKPRPVKAVAIAAPSATPQEGEDATESGTGTAPGMAGAGGAPRSGLPLVSILLFLIGCAAGGAGISALPHVVPGLLPMPWAGAR